MKYPEALKLLQKLVTCKSVSENVEAVNQATDVMKDFMDRHGLYTAIETFNGRKVLFAAKKPGKKHALLFNAHLDVVPPSEDGQFEPVIADGTIIGRGTADDKGNAVAIAQAMVNASPEADIAAFFTADEEIGGSTTRAMVEAGYQPTKIAVISDTNDSGEISVAQKGIIIVKLVAHGAGGHASMPWCFQNPIIRLANALHDLCKKWQNPSENDQWHDSMAPCIINAGSVHNQIPDQAEALLNIRFVTPGDQEKILATIKRLSGLQDVQIVGEICQPVDCPADHPLIQRLKDCMQKTMPETTIRYTRMNGATDARHLADLNLPIAIIGCQGDGIHAKGEYLQIENFELSIDALTDYANSFQEPRRP